MAISPVPFALQNASHPANLFRQAASSLVQPSGGILATGDLAVTQTGTPSMGVLVAPGRVWVPGTEVANVTGRTYSSQAMYYAENDASVTLTIATSNATNPRIDIVYVSVNDQAYSGTLNQANLAVVTGTPNASPVPPALPNNAMALAYVNVAANASSITNTNITSQLGKGLVYPDLASTALTLTSGLYTAASTESAQTVSGPVVFSKGNRVYLDGTATNSVSISFATGTNYVLGTFPTAYAPPTAKFFSLEVGYLLLRAWVTPGGSVQFNTASAFGPLAAGLLFWNLNGMSWSI